MKALNIGLSEKNRHAMAEQLSYLLADEYVLYTKTWKFHWNLKSPHFGALHLFLERQFQDLAEFVDEVAERSLMLGVDADGTLTEFLQKTSLQEKPGENPTDMKMLTLLMLDQETVIRNIRKLIDFSDKIDDQGTNNFLCELMEKHEKMAWMLRAHLM